MSDDKSEVAVLQLQVQLLTVALKELTIEVHKLRVDKARMVGAASVGAFVLTCLGTIILFAMDKMVNTQ